MTLNWLNYFAELGSVTPLGGVHWLVTTTVTQLSIDLQSIYFYQNIVPFTVINIVNYYLRDMVKTF